MWKFLALQCLVDDLIDFWELSIFLSSSLFHEWDRGPGHEKKTTTFRCHVYCFLKTDKDDLNLWLAVTEQVLYRKRCATKMRGCHIKSVGFLLQTNN